MKKMNVFDLLEQDEVWVTQEGETLRLEDMEPRHRRNTLAFLRRRAHELHERMSLYYITVPAPTADIASLMFEREMTEHFEKEPKVWLEEQPLMQRLAALVVEDTEREMCTALRLVASTTVTPVGHVSRLGGIRRGE